jgi:hypothetical protein
MLSAYLVRASPRYVKDGRPRGTLVDPTHAASRNWNSDQRGYYRSTLGGGTPPPTLVVEFGQPPKELFSGSNAVGSLVFLVIGAESSQGSANDRGLLGVGTIAKMTQTQGGTGASRRIALEVNNLAYAENTIKTQDIRMSPFFSASGLKDQTIFGWEGSPSAQNAYRLHDSEARIDADRKKPILSTLAIMVSLDSKFRDELKKRYPGLSSEVEALPTPANQVAANTAAYSPPEFRSEPISSESVRAYLDAKGFSFEPWQVAAFVAAVRTKPFVILAGISGTGKTKLPMLIAEATGAEVEVVSVRPDWTDSSELLGYTNIKGTFVPGLLTRFALEAMNEPTVQHFFVLDEMNIARTEYYLAEVLSAMERRDSDGNSARLLSGAGGLSDSDYADVVMPPNLALIGSVNVDESTFDFSRKVLDRSFVLELNDVDLSIVRPPATNVPAYGARFGASSWRGQPSALGHRSDLNEPRAREALDLLLEIDEILKHARLNVGFRVRDEFVSFVLETEEVDGLFETSSGAPVGPIDIAVESKLLPRIAGSAVELENPLRKLVSLLEGHAHSHAARRVSSIVQRLEADTYASFF